MTMRGLEAVAIAVLAVVAVLFLAALDADGESGRKYREAVSKFIYLGVAVFVVPLGMLCGLVVKIVAQPQPRPPDGTSSLGYYRFRREYQGMHHLVADGQGASDALAA